MKVEGNKGRFGLNRKNSTRANRVRITPGADIQSAKSDFAFGPKATSRLRVVAVLNSAKSMLTRPVRRNHSWERCFARSCVCAPRDPSLWATQRSACRDRGNPTHFRNCAYLEPNMLINGRLRLSPKLMSFDVFGTLISVRESSYEVFKRILAATNARNVDIKEFWEAWEARNIERYWQPYSSYRSICKASLADTFNKFGIEGDADLIERYFDSFARFSLYDDVLRTLDRLARRRKLAIVSNIDDDLLAATPLRHNFDLVCTAERAKGYKPDGTLFRYLIDHSGVGREDILHSGQSQFTDLVGGKPLGLTIAWINRRDVPLSAAVPRPDFIFRNIVSLLDLVEV
jgi:2-haloacid dehalogenase